MTTHPQLDSAALPEEVDKLLRHFDGTGEDEGAFPCCADVAKKLRAHLATQAARIEELKLLCRDIAAAREEMVQREARMARLDALRWVLDVCGHRMTVMDICHIQGAIARLAATPPSASGPAGADGERG